MKYMQKSTILNFFLDQTVLQILENADRHLLYQIPELFYAKRLGEPESLKRQCVLNIQPTQ